MAGRTVRLEPKLLRARAFKICAKIHFSRAWCHEQHFDKNNVLFYKSDYNKLWIISFLHTMKSYYEVQRNQANVYKLLYYTMKYKPKCSIEWCQF